MEGSLQNIIEEHTEKTFGIDIMDPTDIGDETDERIVGNDVTNI